MGACVIVVHWFVAGRTFEREKEKRERERKRERENERDRERKRLEWFDMCECDVSDACGSERGVCEEGGRGAS